MIIVNGKRFYSKDMKAAKPFASANGWDRNDGRNSQWYSLLWDEQSGLVILSADNSGDCYGDYSTKYFDSPASFAKRYSGVYERVWSDIFDDDEEEEPRVSRFCDSVIAGGVELK